MRFREHQDQARAATRRLLLLFLLTVVLTVLAVNGVLALLWSLQTGSLLAYPRWFFETNSVLAAGFILGGSWIETVQLRRGGAYVAEMVGGRELLVPRAGHEQRLRNIVEEMAIASGLKVPRIFVLRRDDSINAFAAGWEQNDSVVAVTRGALERLNRDELQGVVAHEFSHILNGDARLNMRLIGHVWGLQLLFMLGRDLFEATDARGRRTVFVLMGLGVMTVGSIGWLAGRLLKAAVSRQREFLADAAAVEFTRQKDGIGGALRKIAGQGRPAGGGVRSSRAEVISHMLLSSDIFIRGGALATHPPLADRIRRIYGRPMASLPSAVEPMPAGSGRELPDLAYDMGGADGVRALAASTPGPPAAAGDTLSDLPGITTAADPTGRSGAWLDDLLAITWPADLLPTTLAFLVPPDGADAQQVWRTQVADAGASRQDLLLGQVWSLPMGGHQVGFERLLTRCASLPRAQRQQLRAQAHRIVRADGKLGLSEMWHCLLLDHVLEPRRINLLRETHCLSLQACASAVASLTDVLAAQRFRGQPDVAAMQAQWRVNVHTLLALDGLAGDPVPPSLATVTRAVRQLALLSWVSRPQLLKAWCSVMLPEGSVAPQSGCDALRTLCFLIDTPMPPQLQGAYPAQPAALRPTP
jgi:Zn-dependent protease with chaperone function